MRVGKKLVTDDVTLTFIYFFPLTWMLYVYHWAWISSNVCLWCQGDHLPCDWRNEGEGRQRWVISICCHVGCSGCCSALQRAWNHSAAYQTESHRRQQVTNTWPAFSHAVWPSVWLSDWLTGSTVSNRTKTPGPGAQSALRALARSGMKIGRIGKFQCSTSSWKDF